METFWNDRYRESGLAYGEQPNAFFAQFIDSHTPGRILLPADGQGRNGLYAAAKGWAVDAFDFSEEAQKHTLASAKAKGLTINYWIDDLKTAQFEPEGYDAIGLIYVHFPAPLRTDFHHRCLAALKPGGHIVLEAFHPDQMGRPSGGPSSPDRLFTKERLHADFSKANILLLEKAEVMLEEGKYHQGMAAVMRMVVQKPLIGN